MGAAAGIALENGRLQAEQKAHLEELKGSRARVIEAGQRERKRLERNLHDGAQQRLVALSLELSLLEKQMACDADARAQLDQARREIAVSLDELRALARGLHPAVLSGHGLEVALQSLVASAPFSVRLDVGFDERLRSRSRSRRSTSSRKALPTSANTPTPPLRASTSAASARCWSSRSSTTGSAARTASTVLVYAASRTGSRLLAARCGSGARPAAAHAFAQNAVRVAIAEDSVLLREGLARLLTEAEFEVVAQCETADDLLLKVQSYAPDVAIVDIRLPPTHNDEGLRAALEISNT